MRIFLHEKQNRAHIYSKKIYDFGIMINLDKKDSDGPPITFSKIIWKSSILAIILTGPALGIFLGIYYGTGNLIIGAVLGFGVHFTTLAFSGRISNWIVKLQR